MTHLLVSDTPALHCSILGHVFPCIPGSLALHHPISWDSWPYITPISLDSQPSTTSASLDPDHVSQLYSRLLTISLHPEIPMSLRFPLKPGPPASRLSTMGPLDQLPPTPSTH